MATFLAALIVFATAIIGMAVGVVFSNRCLKGTCGGLSSMPDGADHSLCDACAPQPDLSETRSERVKTEA